MCSDSWIDGFEVFECVRKIALIGTPLLLSAYREEQLVVELILCFVAFGLYAHAQPFRSLADDVLALTCQYALDDDHIEPGLSRHTRLTETRAQLALAQKTVDLLFARRRDRASP